MSISLLKALSETGFQASIIATYSCYFPFYEEVILRQLLNRGCTNNILMVDETLCAEAYASEDTRPLLAGLSYTLVPVHLRGAFHPKLVVALGKSKGALFVGSHNATLSGFGLSDEVTNEFRVGGVGAPQETSVIRAALDYLQGFVPSGLTSVAQVFDAVQRNVPWLVGPVSAESSDRIFLATRGDDEDLWARIRPIVPIRPTTLFVCGPFFDKNLVFLQRLMNDVNPKNMIVGIDPSSVNIDLDSALNLRGAKFVDIGGIPHVSSQREVAQRYIHAKIMWFVSSDRELLVTGSANPSRAAFLSESKWRNAEAVVVDVRKGAGMALGLNDLVTAPSIEEKDWSRVSKRQAVRSEVSPDVRGNVVLAVPSNDGFVLERLIGSQIELEAFAEDGSPVGQVATDVDNLLSIAAPEVVRNEAQTLRRQLPGKKPIVVLIHRPDEIAKYVGSNLQRRLRQALGALEEDPVQIETLLRLTEKVIFDLDDIARTEAKVTGQKAGKSNRESEETSPDSLAVDAVGRWDNRKKDRLDSGDILVLMDAFMYRLGVGPYTSNAGPISEEMRSAEEDDQGDDEPPEPVPHYAILAKACRRKVGRLIRRMIKQLVAARSGVARRAVLQLAAVLSVMHTLRVVEQRQEWRSKRLRLVERDDEWRLLKAGAPELFCDSSSLGPKAIEECNGEPFQELSLATGLLAWLAWEIGIDLTSGLKRTSPVHLGSEVESWNAIQMFALVACHLVYDAEARDILINAVQRTGKRGIDGNSWARDHLVLAERLVTIKKAPESVKALDRIPRAGDLVILNSTFDPRVRVTLEVVPSRDSHKITVFDHVNDQRKFLATRVSFVEW